MRALGSGAQAAAIRSLHLASAGVGGALFGLAFSGAGAILPTWAAVVVAAVGIAWVLASERRGARFPVPHRRCATQVPRSLLGIAGPAAGQVAWGAQLGFGFGTYVSVSSVWALAALFVASDVPVALIAGAGFGLARQATAVRLAQSQREAAMFSFLGADERRASLAHAAGVTAIVTSVALSVASAALSLG